MKKSLTAYEEGREAALAADYYGAPARNPYHPSSSAYEAWQAGYDGE